MIITLNTNPSRDLSYQLHQRLLIGEVNTALSTATHPGGKGYNVASALHANGVETLCVMPLLDSDPMRSLVNKNSPVCVFTPAPGRSRVNLSLEDPSGQVTKVNLPGEKFEPKHAQALLNALIETVRSCCDQGCDNSWVALCGSLPNGIGTDFYVRCAEKIRQIRPEVRIALDTSAEPLREAWQANSAAYQLRGTPLFDLFAPNLEELRQVLNVDDKQAHRELETAGWEGQALVKVLIRQASWQGADLLVTCGDQGALLAHCTNKNHGKYKPHLEGEKGFWPGDEQVSVYLANSPRVEVLSTVGAGDASLAGFLAQQDIDLPERLKMSVTWGAAACEQSGTLPPSSERAQELAVQVRVVEF